MHYSQPTHCSFFHVADLFSLKVTYNQQATKIIMALFVPTVNTKEIPHTLETLTRYLPSVLHSTCFNDEKLPFAIEVRSTEIGHLFEHVLLEYLCYFKLLTGHSSAEYSGVTNWNWKKDPWGLFRITIDAGVEDEEIFTKAIEQSIMLLKILLRDQVPSSLPLIPSLPISPTFSHLDD